MEQRKILILIRDSKIKLDSKIVGERNLRSMYPAHSPSRSAKLIVGEYEKKEAAVRKEQERIAKEKADLEKNKNKNKKYKKTDDELYGL